MAVQHAARFTLGGRHCLSRSLALSCILDHFDVQHGLCIGVRMQAGKLLAHAWIECAGTPVNDRTDIAQEYAEFEGLHDVLESLKSKGRVSTWA